MPFIKEKRRKGKRSKPKKTRPEDRSAKGRTEQRKEGRRKYKTEDKEKTEQLVKEMIFHFSKAINIMRSIKKNNSELQKILNEVVNNIFQYTNQLSSTGKNTAPFTILPNGLNKCFTMAPLNAIMIPLLDKNLSESLLNKLGLMMKERKTFSPKDTEVIAKKINKDLIALGMCSKKGQEDYGNSLVRIIELMFNKGISYSENNQHCIDINTYIEKIEGNGIKHAFSPSIIYNEEIANNPVVDITPLGNATHVNYERFSSDVKINQSDNFEQIYRNIGLSLDEANEIQIKEESYKCSFVKTFQPLCNIYVVRRQVVTDKGNNTRGRIINKPFKYSSIGGYELKSLILKSGSQRAGHYKALVKYQDTWYEANSSGATVREIKVKPFIEDQYIRGCFPPDVVHDNVIVALCYFKGESYPEEF